MSSTDFLYLIFLGTGFTVGFGHCIGMCGPIVVSMSLNMRPGNVLVPHVLYNAGRVVTYAILGGIVGLSGSFTAVAANMAAIQKAVLIFSGVFILAMGAAMGGWLPLGKFFKADFIPTGRVMAAYKRLSRSGNALVYFPLGLLLGLLPCGPVYTALLAAAGGGMEAADPAAGFFRGMGLMGAFGLGTVPALLLVARLSGMKWLRARQGIYRAGAVLMMLAGLYFIVKAIRY